MVGDSGDGTEFKLFSLMTKAILPESVAESIIETESQGEEAYRLLVEDRYVERKICGRK